MFEVAAPCNLRLALPLALVLAGCGDGLDASSPATVGDTIGVPDGEGEGESTDVGPECVTDADCPSSQYCSGGVCEWWCGAPLPTDGGGEISNGPLTPRCSEDDSWEDPTETGDGDGDPDIPCESSEDCPATRACLANLCTSAPALHACAGPTLAEVPLPALPEQPVVALAFVDFDADGSDELALLCNGALVIVDGPTTHELAVPPLLDRLTVAQLDDDGVPDLLLGQSKAAATYLVRGSVDAAPTSFELVELGELALAQSVAVDWIPGGTDEIVQTSSVLATPPQIVAEIASGTPAVIPLDAVTGDRVGVGDFGGDPAPELLFARDCQAQVLAGADIGLIFEDQLGTAGCEFVPARLGAAELDSVYAWVPADGFGLLVRLPFDGPRELHIVAGQHARAVPVTMPGVGPEFGMEALLLLDPGANWAWSSGDDGLPDCQDPAPELDLAVEVVSGDFDGDGSAELASLDAAGVVRLWTAG